MYARWNICWVHVDWSMRMGPCRLDHVSCLCGLVHVGWSILVGPCETVSSSCCGLIHVDWSKWFGPCRLDHVSCLCELIYVGWSMWFVSCKLVPCGLVHVGFRMTRIWSIFWAINFIYFCSWHTAGCWLDQELFQLLRQMLRTENNAKLHMLLNNYIDCC